jgi:hypothetical protein
MLSPWQRAHAFMGIPTCSHILFTLLILYKRRPQLQTQLIKFNLHKISKKCAEKIFQSSKNLAMKSSSRSRLRAKVGISYLAGFVD